MARIESFHKSETDNQKLMEIGLHVGKEVKENDVIRVVKQIFLKTNLNVMLAHLSDANSVIWVDEGKFKQK